MFASGLMSGLASGSGSGSGSGFRVQGSGFRVRARVRVRVRARTRVRVRVQGQGQGQGQDQGQGQGSGSGSGSGFRVRVGGFQVWAVCEHLDDSAADHELDPLHPQHPCHRVGTYLASARLATKRPVRSVQDSRRTGLEKKNVPLEAHCCRKARWRDGAMGGWESSPLLRSRSTPRAGGALTTRSEGECAGAIGPPDHASHVGFGVG